MEKKDICEMEIEFSAVEQSGKSIQDLTEEQLRSLNFTMGSGKVIRPERQATRYPEIDDVADDGFFKPLNVGRGMSNPLMYGLGGDYDGTMLIPLKLTNRICMYFWMMINAREFVRTKDKLSHTVLFQRNQRNCILYASAMREIPALRKLYKMFIKEAKSLGHVNLVITKYGESHVTSPLDEELQRLINEHNHKLEKRMPPIKEKKHVGYGEKPMMFCFD